MWYKTRGSRLTFTHTHAYTDKHMHTHMHTNTYVHTHTVHNPPAKDCQRESETLWWHFHAWDWAVSACSYLLGTYVSLELQEGARNYTLLCCQVFMMVIQSPENFTKMCQVSLAFCKGHALQNLCWLDAIYTICFLAISVATVTTWWQNGRKTCVHSTHVPWCPANTPPLVH